MDFDFTKYFTSKVKNITLTEHQKSIFLQLIDFVINNDERVFILKGYAGTGKTTMMGGFIKWLEEKAVLYKLLASTGRAAKILSDKTGRKADTIHSLLYSFKDVDADLEALSILEKNGKLEKKGQLTLLFEFVPLESDAKTVYIVDESSMISDMVNKGSSFAEFGSGNLLKELLEYDPNGKYLFLGDPCQLPPIGQEDSPALTAHLLINKYKQSVRENTLTLVHRNANSNSLASFTLSFRNYINNHHLNPNIWFKMKVKNNKDVTVLNSEIALIQQYFSNIQNYGFEHSTIICHSNKGCSEANDIIRKMLYGDKKELQIGDLLLVTQNNYLVDLVNGDQVIVTEIGNRFERCFLRYLEIEVQELSSKEKFRILLQEDVLYSNAVNITPQQHRTVMIDFYNRMKQLGIKQRSKEFKDRMMKDPYLNALKAVYGYAITCHKSQGGEWDEVFLYLTNSIFYIERPGLFQWLYTAVSRAKIKLWVNNHKLLE